MSATMTPALTDATDRVAQRIKLAGGDLAAAFDRLGTGLQADALINLASNIDDAEQLALMVGLVVAESDRGHHQLLAKQARTYAEVDRQWRKDVHAGQLSLDGIEPARYVPAQAVTHHQRLRTGLLIRAGGACEDCGRRRTLQVHHLTYDRYGHEEPTDVLMLCRDCHERRHGRTFSIG